MNINTIFSALLKNWWVIVLAAALTTASAAIFVFRQAPIYEATATVEMRPNPDLDTNAVVYITGTVLDKRTTINTLARKATSSAIQQEVAEALGVPAEVVAAAGLNSIVVPESNLIEVEARSTDPQLAAAIANTTAQKMLGKTLENIVEVTVIDEAIPPTSPVEPQPSRVITLGLLFGLVLGVLTALLMYLLQHGALSAGGPAKGQTTLTRPLEGRPDPAQRSLNHAVVAVGESDRVDDRA